MRTLTLNIGISYYLLALLVLLHAGVILAIIICAISVWIKALLIFGVLISLLYQLRQHVWRKNKTSITCIHAEYPSRWSIENSLGQRHSVTLAPQYLANQFLIILNFQRVRFLSLPVLIMCDAVDKDHFRQLLIRLRYMKSR